MAQTNEQLCAVLKQGDRSALDTLVEQNMSFLQRKANKLANQFRRPHTVNDLVQEGAIALMEAAERYDPAHGALFQNYADKRVFKAMRNHLDFLLPPNVTTWTKLPGPKNRR